MNHEAIQSTQTTRASVSAGIFGFRLERFRQMCRKNRRGAAVVEFALISPLFFLLILGMVEYGRLVMVQQILTNASREGARMAVLDGATKASVENWVSDYLNNTSVSGHTVTVTPANLAAAGYGEPVTVTVSVTFDQVSWLPSPMFLKGRQMTATTVMRRESVQ